VQSSSRTCSRCRKSEPEAEFPPYRSSYCTACRPLAKSDWAERSRADIRAKESLQRAERHRRDPEGEWRKELDKYLRSAFHITVDDYDRMYAEQGSCCGICRKPGRGSAKPTNGGTRLAVDHDRRCCPGVKSCGKCIRGLLCGSCNPKLGFYELFESQCIVWRERRVQTEEVVLDVRKDWRRRSPAA